MLILAAATVIPDGEVFECTPTRVWDGDGPIWCAEGPRIRLAGIATREMDETCRDGHPCPDVKGIEVICPLLSGPISILGMATKEEWNGKEAQAGRYHWQV
ncbi:MAG: hypothetical protein ACLGHF_08770, partial [Alphaproteobacteria bacterium]